MIQTLHAADFLQWRSQARALLLNGVTPLEVSWADAAQPGLFGMESMVVPPDMQFTVPAAFLKLAPIIACHRDVRKWDLLYQLLFRMHHGEKNLLRIAVDPLIHALQIMQSAIRRDAHKTKAFVRFRQVMDEDGHEHYIAWHRPDHRVLPLVAGFFSRRFSSMRWTILTPLDSLHWDGVALQYGPGVDASAAPEADVLEDLWRDYYRATFNPARIKLKMMKREMPVRHWKTLPEARIIPDLLAEAPARVEQMIAHSEGMTRSAAEYLPVEKDIPHLKAASMGCAGCELHAAATQTVFGEGPADAALMLVGEQPGDEEDRNGHAFVGPAGHLLEEILAEVGLVRSALYITNAVKHFRYIYKDSFRQHQSPSRYHVQACKPWLTAEITAVRPRLVMCLGNTAARALIHPNFVMKDRVECYSGSPALMASYHPSSILRLRGAAKQKARDELTSDLARAVEFLAVTA